MNKSVIQKYEEFKCNICGKYIKADEFELHNLAEIWLIKRIEADHPEWIETSGECPKCIEYYQKL